MNQSKIELSDPLSTVVYKWLLPLVIFLTYLFAEKEKLTNYVNFKGIFYSENFGFCLIGIALVLFTGRLKRVWIEGGQLYISNLFKTVTVSKSNIEEVKETILSHPKFIKIKFKEKTPFGYKIKFIPLEGSFWTSSQRTVDKLKN